MGGRRLIRKELTRLGSTGKVIIVSQCGFRVCAPFVDTAAMIVCGSDMPYTASCLVQLDDNTHPLRTCLALEALQ